MSRKPPDPDVMLDCIRQGFDKTLALVESIETPEDAYSWWQAMDMALKMQLEAMTTAEKHRNRK